MNLLDNNKTTLNLAESIKDNCMNLATRREVEQLDLETTEGRRAYYNLLNSAVDADSRIIDELAERPLIESMNWEDVHTIGLIAYTYADKVATYEEVDGISDLMPVVNVGGVRIEASDWGWVPEGEQTQAELKRIAGRLIEIWCNNFAGEHGAGQTCII